MASGASIYIDPAEAYAVTPQMLPPGTTQAPLMPTPTRITDPLNAGGPAPVNALSIPTGFSSPVNLAQTPPGFLPNGQPDPNYRGADPSDATAPQVKQATAAATRLVPITTTTPVATKPAAPEADTAADSYTAYVTGAPYSLSRFQGGILHAEGGTPTSGYNDPNAARGIWQARPDTVRDPGFGIQGGDPNNPADVDRVGQAYSQKMYETYGPVMGAVAYNQGPGFVNRAIVNYGDPTKGQISMEDWVNKVDQANPRAGIKGYLNRVAGGHMALPGQTPSDQTAVASAVDPGPTRNPLAMSAQQSQADMQAQMKKYWAMAALSSLLPKGFAFHPIDINPFMAAAKRGMVDAPRYMASGFETPRVVFGSGQGPSAPAISPAGVTPVTLRRRGE